VNSCFSKWVHKRREKWIKDGTAKPFGYEQKDGELTPTFSG